MSKYKFKQNVPDPWKSFEAKEFEFNTLEELLKYKKVANYKELPVYNFHRFSKAPYVQNQWHLIAEYNDGMVYWVIGWIENGEDLDLPIKEQPKRELKE